MKKGLMIAAGIFGVSLIASEIMKKITKNKSVEEKAVDENSAGDCDNAEPKPKKMQNHNENMTRVNNSLISIKIKVFSK